MVSGSDHITGLTARPAHVTLGPDLFRRCRRRRFNDLDKSNLPLSRLRQPPVAQKRAGFLDLNVAVWHEIEVVVIILILPSPFKVPGFLASFLEDSMMTASGRLIGSQIAPSRGTRWALSPAHAPDRDGERQTK